MEEAAKGHKRNSIGVRHLKPVRGALAWSRRCHTEGAVGLAEEGPFLAQEHAGEEGVIG